MRWKRMFFGEKGASHNMQQVMEVILGELPHLREYIKVYVNNIFVFTKGLSPKRHGKILSEVVKKLSEHNLRLNVKKCKIGYRKMNVLGQLTSASERSISRERKASILAVRKPRTGKDMASLLGMANFFRKYLPNFSMVVEPLNAMKKIKQFERGDWMMERTEAITNLRVLLKGAVVLQEPDWNREFRLVTDASQKGIGAVLYQVSGNDRKKVISYALKGLTQGQKNYSAPRRELLAVIYALAKYRYLPAGEEIRA
jgi:hypothetical protein